MPVIRIKDEKLILHAKAAGQQQITAPQFDSVYGITELKPEPGNWVNMCAAKFYGVQSISAVENYWESQFIRLENDQARSFNFNPYPELTLK